MESGRTPYRARPSASQATRSKVSSSKPFMLMLMLMLMPMLMLMLMQGSKQSKPSMPPFRLLLPLDH